jgi:hypothetical protein
VACAGSDVCVFALCGGPSQLGTALSSALSEHLTRLLDVGMARWNSMSAEAKRVQRREQRRREAAAADATAPAAEGGAGGGAGAGAGGGGSDEEVLAAMGVVAARLNALFPSWESVMTVPIGEERGGLTGCGGGTWEREGRGLVRGEGPGVGVYVYHICVYICVCLYTHTHLVAWDCVRGAQG